jgi:enoyl-CoA hydratase
MKAMTTNNPEEPVKAPLCQAGLREALVTVEKEGDIARIRMDDGRGNAFGTRLLQELDQALEEAGRADSALLTGRARIFSGGLDLPELAAFSRSELHDFLALLHRVRRKAFIFPRPLVIAASGSAVGAGASVLCCGDTRIGARDRGTYSLPEVKLGLPVETSGLEIVMFSVSSQYASQFMIFGTSLTPDAACDAGILHRLVDADELEAVAVEAACAGAELSGAVAHIKLSCRQAALRRMDEDRDESHRSFVSAWETPETQVLVASALEKIGRRMAA